MSSGAAPAGRGSFPALTGGRMRSASPSRHPGRRIGRTLPLNNAGPAPGPDARRHFRPRHASGQGGRASHALHCPRIQGRRNIRLMVALKSGARAISGAQNGLICDFTEGDSLTGFAAARDSLRCKRTRNAQRVVAGTGEAFPDEASCGKAPRAAPSYNRCCAKRPWPGGSRRRPLYPSIRRQCHLR
jgi:hypothetical protein